MSARIRVVIDVHAACRQTPEQVASIVEVASRAGAVVILDAPTHHLSVLRDSAGVQADTPETFDQWWSGFRSMFSDEPRPSRAVAKRAWNAAREYIGRHERR